MLKIIRTNDQIKSFSQERKVVAFKLNQIINQGFGFQKIGQVFVGVDPEASLLPEKITKRALARAEFESLSFSILR